MAAKKTKLSTDEETPVTPEKPIGERLAALAVKQLDASVKFKQPRLNAIKKSEDMYLGVVKKSLKGRFNVALPIMQGYVDTLRAKLDNPPRLKLGPGERSDLFRARKAQAAWDRDSSSVKAMWPRKDRNTRFLSMFSGRGTSKIYAESDPEYMHHLDVVDHHDFHCEPMGGSWLEDHAFVGQTGIFRTASELKKNGESGWYDAEVVRQLTTGMSAKSGKENKDLYQNRVNRQRALGLDPETYAAIGISVFHIVDWYMEFEGTRYHLIFEYDTGKPLRAEELKTDFKSNLYPYVSFATHEDPFNFWSKAPCDDMRAVCEAMNILFNQALDNRQKINFGQRAVDPSFFPDPNQLSWSRPDGIIIAKSHNNKPISEGVYEFKTPEIEGTINLFQFLDNFLGQKTGATASAQGATDKDAKVGVYFGDLQQVSDRMGLYNKSYSESWAELGLRYLWGLKEHMPHGYIVRIMGASGAEDQELAKDDIDPDFDIQIVSDSDEAAATEIEKKQKLEALTSLTPDEQLTLSPKWRAEQKLRIAGYKDEEIRNAQDVKDSASEEIAAIAAEALNQLVDGKEEPKLFRAATTAFVQRIVDFADNSDLDMETWKRVMAYASAHIPIMQENAARKAAIVVAQTPPDQRPQLPPPGSIPGPTEGLPGPAQPMETPAAPTAGIAQ